MHLSDILFLIANILIIATSVHFVFTKNRLRKQNFTLGVLYGERQFLNTYYRTVNQCSGMNDLYSFITTFNNNLLELESTDYDKVYDQLISEERSRAKNN